MTQSERESLAGDFDPHSMLFGDADDDVDSGTIRLSRADRRRNDHWRRGRRRRWRGRFVVPLTLLIVAAVALFVVPRVIDYFAVPDYSGGASGSVTITVMSGASASDIGDILKRSGVVKSTQAFTDAASNNTKSKTIQPGQYQLHKHMSGKAALTTLLDPTSRRASGDVVVREGVTSFDVTVELVKSCAARQSAVTAALRTPADLGIPVTYKAGARVPSSVEGFLYPATYTPDSCTNPGDVLQRMVSRFIQQDRDTNFARDAHKVGLTPYQALIVASIAQAEAKFALDMPKVARVILNRLQAKTALQVDPPSVYAAKLQGVDPSKIIYSKIDSPYNTYTHTGLPPTPINNPGAAAMAAAVHAAPGNWLFYVNSDAAGHLLFTHDDKAFAKAKHRCFVSGWGCAGP